MRITDQILRQGALRSLQARLASVALAQREVGSGRRISTVSDDPLGATQIMRFDAQLRDIDQYRRTGTAASTRLSTELAVLDNVRDLISRAHALALSAATFSPDDPVRKAALTEVQLIQTQLVSLGSTRIGNQYIFGGAVTSGPPFLADGSYVGDQTVLQAEIDTDLTIDVNRPGDQVLSPALQAVAQLAQELATGTTDSIQATIPVLAAADQQVLVRQAGVGAGLQQIADTSTLLGQRAASVADSRDALQGADPTEASLEAVTAQNALERAYAAIGRLFSKSLIDFLS